MGHRFRSYYYVILSNSNRFPESLELKLIRTVGENLPAAVRGQTNILQHMMQDNLLNRFYEQALGVIENTSFMARVVGQISHRYPQMNILEIGQSKRPSYT